MGKRRFQTTVLILGLPFLPACFTTRPATLDDLQKLDQGVVVRITLADGETSRWLVESGCLDPDSLRCQPLRHGPSSWIVRWAGWPIVYTAGKKLRYVPEEGETRIPLDRIRGLGVERFSWGWTLLSLPLTLPPGIIDFIVHHATFGFEDTVGRD